MCLGFSKANAQYIQSIANGSWHDPATWDCNCVPGPANFVTVSHAVTVASGTADAFTVYIDNSAGVNASLNLTGGITTVPNGMAITGFANSFTSDLTLSNDAILNVTGGDGITVRSAQTGNMSVRISLSNTSQANVCGMFYHYEPADAVPENQMEVSVTDSAILQFSCGSAQLEYNSATKNSQLTFWVDKNAMLLTNSFHLVNTEGGGAGTRVMLQTGLTATSTCAVNVLSISLTDLDGSAPFSGDRVVVETHNSSSIYTLGFDLTSFSATPTVGYNVVRGFDNSHITVAQSGGFGGDITFNSASLSPDDNLIEMNDNAILEMQGNTVNPEQGTFTYNDNSSAWFTGSVQQTIPYTDHYVNMRLNNTSGQNFLLPFFITVSGDLNFIRGIVDTGLYILLIQDNATVSGANDLSYVDGYVQKNGDDAFTFPVGDNGYYRPLSISIPSPSSEITVRYGNQQAFSNLDRGPGLTTVSECEYWTMVPDGAPNVDVTLSWNSNQCTNYNITDINDLRVVRWNDGTSLWESEGNGGTTGNAIAGTVTTGSPLTIASEIFTLGSVSVLSPLPIELLEFTATQNNNTISLEWSTATELNNDHFIIEHSSSGKDFLPIGRVEGNGTTKTIHSYSFTDTKPLPGKNYYRLAQYDLDGRKQYSPIRYVNIETDDKALQIDLYPNPAKDEIKIKSNRFLPKANVVFYDLISGGIVWEKYFDLFAWEQAVDINSIKPGLYRVFVSSEAGKANDRVVVVR